MKRETVGLDLGKTVFQAHVASADRAPLRHRLTRNEVLPFFAALSPALVGMEACGASHFWAQQIERLGHEVRLVSPAFVKPYRRGQKNDRSDAAAICDAVSVPEMRFVAIKTVDQQAVLMLHRSRALLITQMRMSRNALRGHLAELGHIAPVGNAAFRRLIGRLPLLIERIPSSAALGLSMLAKQAAQTDDHIKAIEKELHTWGRSDRRTANLLTVPGVGLLGATGLSATVGDPRQFRSGRDLAAFLGLVPKQFSSGGKVKLGRISKQGDGYLRRLLVMGAMSAMRPGTKLDAGTRDWLNQLLLRRPRKLVAVALANKLARVCWKIMITDAPYGSPEAMGAGGLEQGRHLDSVARPGP